jgi:hypothetical protein
MLTVICLSRFGTRTLPRVLSAYEHLEAPRGGWKLIVVDSCGSGRAAAMLKSYATRLPLEVVRVSCGDLPTALNTALRASAGDLLVITDSNSIPAPNWLSSLREAAYRRPEFAVFAGSIIPCWDGAPERGDVAWDEQGLIYALSEPRSDEGPIAPELVWAPNIAVRGHVFLRGLGFGKDSGSSGLREPLYPDTESLIDSVCMAAHRTWYVPQAAVRLTLSEWRLEGPWIMRPALRRGRAMASLELDRQTGRVRGALYFLWSAIRLLCKRQVGFWRARLSGDLQAACRARWRRDLALGKLLECQRQWPSGRVG